MINILTEVFTIKGSFRFFYELENILGSGYLEQYADQMYADLEKSLTFVEIGR